MTVGRTTVVVAATLLVSAAACNGIVGFDELERVKASADGGPSEEKPDAMTVPVPTDDASVPAARCDPTKPFGAPALLSVDTTAELKSGLMTPDELELFYLRGKSSPFEFRHAVRASRAAPWGEPTTEAFSTNAVSLGSIAVRGLKLYYLDVVVVQPSLSSFPTAATRPALGRAWGNATKLTGPGTSSAIDVIETDDGAYWSEFVAKDGGPADSYIFRGNVVGDGVLTGTVVEGIHALGSNDSLPVVIKNETTMYFESRRPGGIADSDDIWRATRRSKADPFEPATLVTELSSAGYDEPTWVSEDECVVLLNRASHIYIAQRP